ncbi:MAG: preprotein translocase subunit SecG [Candidatus Pacebacteria bacterium]|nr:preprotein translocase subunit SecG [Candidatus Paceibacterota bacterium]MBP9867167.1 preprotein translocase subunit SecG [Candidatus Paceibacterota bacterium]
MFQLLSIVQLILATLLIALVLIQRANTDASGAFGADGGSSASLEKRGAEKSLHRLTILVVILFVTSLASNIVFH